MDIHYIPTGNEFISLPVIVQGNASIESFTLLHMRYKGMLAFHGSDSTPLFMPFVRINGEPVPLSPLCWKRIENWIPTFVYRSAGVSILGTILCPIGHRGFAIRLTVRNEAETLQNITLGLTGLWAGVTHSVNEDKNIHGELLTYISSWSNAPVFDFRIGSPVMAFAPMSNLPMTWDTKSSETGISYEGNHTGTIDPGTEITLDVFWGVGYEEVAAVTAAKEQLRHGFASLFESTSAWLVSHRKTVCDERLDKILNENLFFNYFYATGITIDTEEVVMVTSRSPRYYVSAAYWDRDALLWSFPAILRIDKEYAHSLLNYIFTRQIRNVGVHSRYIDGTVLEPGFELDELCAPVLALTKYVDVTNDTAILSEPHIEKGIRHILCILAGKRSPSLGLYETFLQPTDDMHTHAYLTYNNVLVWRMLTNISRLYKNLWDTETLKQFETDAVKLHDAILTNCIKTYEGQNIYVWSIGKEGAWDVYDEPPGSLQLLPSLGFCSFDDAVWQNTVEIIRRSDYAYSFTGKPFADIGCAHAPHPWILSVCNSLLCGRIEAATDFLLRAAMDNGIACESVDEHTGLCTTGAAFATCAGFLAECMLAVLDGGETK